MEIYECIMFGLYIAFMVFWLWCGIIIVKERW